MSVWTARRLVGCYACYWHRRDSTPESKSPKSQKRPLPIIRKTTSQVPSFIRNNLYTRVIQEPSDGKKLIKVKVKFFLSATFCHFSPDQIIQNTAQKSDDGMF